MYNTQYSGFNSPRKSTQELEQEASNELLREIEKEARAALTLIHA